jgi:hypothetical protein
MKKITALIVFALLLGISAGSTAQTVGVKAGLNFANVAIDEDDTEGIEANMGYFAGITAEFPVGSALAVETGLFASQKGYKMDYSYDAVSITGSFSPIYLEVPIQAKLYFDLGVARLFAAAGPYVAYGLAGNTKYESSIGNESDSDSDKIEWGTELGKINPLDYGLLLGAGASFGTLEVGLSYGYGMGNLSNHEDDKVSNRVLGIFVALKFGGS